MFHFFVELYSVGVYDLLLTGTPGSRQKSYSSTNLAHEKLFWSDQVIRSESIDGQRVLEISCLFFLGSNLQAMPSFFMVDLFKKTCLSLYFV